MVRRAATPAPKRTGNLDTVGLTSSTDLWDATPVAANTSHPQPSYRRSSFSDLSRSVSDLWSYATSCSFHDTTTSTPCGPLHSRAPHPPLSISKLHTKQVTSKLKEGSSHQRMRITTGAANTMNDSENSPKNDALSTAATEEDDLEEDDAAAEVVANGPTIAMTADCHLPTFGPAPEGAASTNKKSTVQNCFSEPPLTLFSVRGPTYMIDQKKVASDPYLLKARGLDLFLTDKQHPVVLDQMTHALLGGQLRSKPTLAVNFRFPWGYMNLYFEVPAKLSVHLPRDENGTSSSSVPDDSLTIAERTLALWLLGDTPYRNERLKLIPYVAQGPWVVRNMVTGRPAIIGKKLPVSYQSFATSDEQHPLLMATLDIGNSSATAQRIVSVCRRYMAALTVDIGLVIQGNATEELPEQMMGAMRVHGPDPGQAPTVR